MKANELMLGDIVTFKDSLNSDDGIVPIKIDAIGYQDKGGENEVLVSINGCRHRDIIEIDDEIVGIPLTPEILKKNGFYFGNTTNEEDFCSSTGAGLPGEGWCWDEGGGEVKIIFPIGSDGGLVRLDDGFFDKYLEFVFANPICVHHLQHLLRLCGINLEIQL